MAKGNIGTVVQVIGPVLDIRFKDGELPQLLNAVEVESGEKKLTVEVAQHIGDDVVRCIAMSSTDGLTRGHHRPGRRKVPGAHLQSARRAGG